MADADPELRDTLCVYISEQFSAARAARALYTHRNTVLNRLQRAERLLPSRSPATASKSASRSRSPSGSDDHGSGITSDWADLLAFGFHAGGGGGRESNPPAPQRSTHRF